MNRNAWFVTTVMVTILSIPVTMGQTGGILYSDDFSDSTDEWYVPSNWSAKTYAMYNEDGRLHLIAKNTDTIIYARQPSVATFDNFAAEVEALAEGGPENNDFGLILRMEDDDNFYRFKVSSDGYYGFDMQKYGDWIDIIKWKKTDYINQGIGATNMVKAICDGDQFTLFINGVEVDSCTDDSFARGDVGVEVGTYDEPNVHVSFDDFLVTSISPAEITTSTSTSCVSDDFSNPNLVWYSPDWSASTFASYNDGSSLHLISKKTNSVVFALQPMDRTFTDFVMQVDATMIAGPEDNDFGLIFRYQDQENFYRFKISADGYCGLDKIVDGQWENIVPWTKETSVNMGQATNNLKVECKGNQITVYANGMLLKTAMDSTFSSGDAGVEVGTASEGNVHVSFDNFQICPI